MQYQSRLERLANNTANMCRIAFGSLFRRQGHNCSHSEIGGMLRSLRLFTLALLCEESQQDKKRQKHFSFHISIDRQMKEIADSAHGLIDQ